MKLFKGTYKNDPDEQLMLKVANGDASAFEVIYDRYNGPLMGYFYRMLWQDREKAEDFVQDLFTKIIHKPHLYDPKRPFKTWLYSVANNMCKNEYRKQEVRKGTNNSIDAGVQVKDDNANPSGNVDLSNFSQALEDALNELEDKHRQVFILRFKMNLSIKEIADTMDISDGTVKSRIFYCLKKLSAQLADFDPAKKEELYG